MNEGKILHESLKEIARTAQSSNEQIVEKRIHKKCLGCCDNFTCPQSKNYDYCRNCELNDSRYIPKENKCAECGDGSGWIKFPNQPPRPCKLCSLNKPILHYESRTSKKIHELMGIITHKEPYKVYHKNSPHHGNLCYKLQMIIKNEPEKNNLFIYPNLVDPSIYQTIEQSQFIDKHYLFFCEKKKKGWILHNWKELHSNLSDFDKSRQLSPPNTSTENHEKK